MIQDKGTNFLYLADCLPKKYPKFFKGFKKAIKKTGIKYELLSPTKDIWAKDYMPVQVGEKKFVQFKYHPSYLRPKKWQRTITNVDNLVESFPWSVKKAKLIVDGGNVVKGKNKVIMCDQVFVENPSITRKKLIRKLKKELKVEEIIIIPKEPNDIIGHADGMVRFKNKNTVLVNDYSKANPKYRKKLLSAIKKAGLNYVEIPYAPTNIKNSISAEGFYINYLQLKGVIFVPVFKKKEDAIALKQFKQLFKGSKIIPVQSNEIAKQGGVLNCISWNIYQKPLTKKQIKELDAELDRDILCAGLE